MVSTLSKHATVAVSVCVLAWCSAAAAAECNRYRVQRLDPKFSDVCDAAVRALNERCADDRFGCEIPRALQEAGFTQPRWTRVELKSNLGLLEKLVRGTSMAQRYGDDAERYADTMWASVKSRLSSSPGMPCLGVAELDVLGDGKPVRMYRLRYDDCSLPNSFVHQSELYPAEAARYFTERTGSADGRGVFRIPGLFAAAIFDVVQYRGRTFFTGASPAGDEWGFARPISVEGPHQFTWDQVCTVIRSDRPEDGSP